ncbi:MAG: TatD family hydrolase [Halanaerobium sp.]|nr:TatD family hydrolase [Halanaerobium sp.]
MELIDTHAHLDDRRFNKDREEVIKRAGEQGVKTIVNIGANLASSRQAVEIARQWLNIWAVVGIHPHQAREVDSGVLRAIERLAGDDRVLAIGEIGLDYHYDNSPRDIQRRVFRTQLRLAHKLELPVVIHSREAEEDTLQIMEEEDIAGLGGIMHCFPGGLEFAQRCIDMNLYLAFGGILTFGSADTARSVVEKMPLEYLLLETDCPYLTPHPHRGKRNEPAYVRLVAEKVAEIRGLQMEKVAEITSRNFWNLFTRR